MTASGFASAAHGRNGLRQRFFPLRLRRIPRGAKKRTRRRPPRMLRAFGCVRGSPGPSQAIEAALGRARGSQGDFIMATIGNFKKTANDEFVGEIVTLSVQAKGVRIVPDSNPASENAPSHRVMVGRAEIGAAWTKRSNEGRDYLGLKLDDPSFTAPIYANLFDDEDGETFNLIWSRPSRRNGD
ncbi:protein of unknown function DUF736 [Rhizorhabdus wittichii RW1]|uniref:DUF736 domain-containing protein n=1 Tax=Rhizorhabdus wittichii (strain DSM 6014 / CCUG 31198 / JCM 15750 / NBRC 105917 / EY 4224 / RW1) TaxID=392499 RepID=A0A9J9H7V2_RHIWR|nr:protein of unknown function DUF736 [Rhizorhabdus wittichii RW1]